MDQFAKPYKNALDVIKSAIPDDIMRDQLNEGFLKIEKVWNSIK